MEERDERLGDDRPAQRDRPQRRGEFGVGDVREAADHDVWRVAGDVAVDPTFDAIATASR
jgi:hypothetical protein